MKKILITRKLLRTCEDKAKETFDANLNLNDELYSQQFCNPLLIRKV